jgi:hypothetical protein
MLPLVHLTVLSAYNDACILLLVAAEHPASEITPAVTSSIFGAFDKYLFIFFLPFYGLLTATLDTQRPAQLRSELAGFLEQKA